MTKKVVTPDNKVADLVSKLQKEVESLKKKVLSLENDVLKAQNKYLKLEQKHLMLQTESKKSKSPDSNISICSLAERMKEAGIVVNQPDSPVVDPILEERRRLEEATEDKI